MNQVTISIPNPEDKLDALHYEMWMLNSILHVSNSVLSNLSSSQVVSNALLESFLVHARNLKDFLEKTKQDDDIVCSDFLDNNGLHINKISVNLQSDIKNKINKYLSHLTETRMHTKPAWKLDEIKKEVNKSLEVFFNQLSDKYFPTQGDRNKDSFLDLLK